MARIGLISDTHGVLRPEAIAFLRGCEHIIHGGDIGHEGILAQLSELAPVTAVRGNNDKGAWAEALAETELVQLDDIVERGSDLAIHADEIPRQPNGKIPLPVCPERLQQGAFVD